MPTAARPPAPARTPTKAPRYSKLQLMRCECGNIVEYQIVVTMLTSEGKAYQDTLVLCGACYVLMLEVESKP